MLGDFEVLLTDEFEGFASKIKQIHDTKKTKTGEIKALYEKFQSEITALDSAAKSLYEEWQASASKEKSVAKAATPPKPKA